MWGPWDEAASISLWEELRAPSQLWLLGTFATLGSISMFKKLSADWDFKSCSPSTRRQGIWRMYSFNIQETMFPSHAQVLENSESNHITSRCVYLGCYHYLSNINFACLSTKICIWLFTAHYISEKPHTLELIILAFNNVDWSTGSCCPHLHLCNVLQWIIVL